MTTVDAPAAPATAILFAPEAIAGPAVSRRASRAWPALLIVLGISAAYVAWHLDRGWIPWDDGALGQSAERVLGGQLPHRDFNDPYTGLLAMIDAVGFRFLGTTLWTLRVVMFAVFLAWVPALYYVASRFVRPLAAAGMTLLAVVWSVPNYPAAMPSWYNLFLATFGVAALLRHVERPQLRWLIAAGVMGGLSFLIKVVGLYYVAGVLLYLVFREQEQARARPPSSDRHAERWYALFLSGMLSLFVLVLWTLIRNQRAVGETLQFVLPGAVLAMLLARDEWTLSASRSRDRFIALTGLVAPFLLGVVIPVLIFLVPYARSGALGTFVTGVFVLPMRRLTFAAAPALGLRTALALVPLAIIAAAVHLVPERHRRALAGVVAVVAVALLAMSARHDGLYAAVWAMARNLLPALAVLGALVLARRRSADAAAPLLREQTMVLLCATALFNLIQFPFVVPIYFCYVAPLVALSALALFRYLGPTGRAVPTIVLAFFVMFGVLRVNMGSLASLGHGARRYGPITPLRLERGGILVKDLEANVYNQLIPMLRQRARGGYTWASPDCPEMYFLSGLQNPTRSLFDFFEEPTGKTERALSTIERHGITAIVMSMRPSFSPQLSAELVAELERRFPFATNVGPFQLRWRT